MKVSLDKISIGTGIKLVVLGGLLYVLYRVVKGGANGLQTLGEDIGGGIYTAFNGDANAQVQQQFQSETAELAAAGYPPVGSDAYNAIVVKWNPAQVVINSLTGKG